MSPMQILAWGLAVLGRKVDTTHPEKECDK